MKNKKGISAIVATVLIILITVAAVTIIWAAIIPMIQNTIEGSQECFDASAALSVITDYSCVDHGVCDNVSVICQASEDVCITTGTGECNGVWDDDAGSVSVQVHRGTGSFVLTGVEIIYGAEGNTQSEIFTADSTEGVPDPNGDKVYDISYTEFGEVSEAGVAAIVQAGNTDEVCGKSGMIQIPECSN